MVPLLGLPPLCQRLSSPAPCWQQAVWGRRLLPPAAQPQHPATVRKATHRWLALAESQFNPVIGLGHSPLSLLGDLHTQGKRPPLGTSQASSVHCMSSRSWGKSWWQGPTGGALPAWSRWNKSTWESWCWSLCYGSSYSQLWSSQNIRQNVTVIAPLLSHPQEAPCQHPAGTAGRGEVPSTFSQHTHCRVTSQSLCFKRNYQINIKGKKKHIVLQLLHFFSGQEW